MSTTNQPTSETKMKKKKIVSYQKERDEGIRAVANKLAEKIKLLPTDKEKAEAGMIVIALKSITPTPRVSRVIGQFLIDMADEQDKQDKKFGTDSNDPDQVIIAVPVKGGGHRGIDFGEPQ
jgi:hypothetical protein